MGRKTSVYLADDILAALADDPRPLAEVIRAGLGISDQAADVVTEYGQQYTSGGYLTRNPAPEIEHVYPLADWIRNGTANGGRVFRRRLIVVDDWAEVTGADRRG